MLNIFKKRQNKCYVLEEETYIPRPHDRALSIITERIKDGSATVNKNISGKATVTLPNGSYVVFERDDSHYISRLSKYGYKVIPHRKVSYYKADGTLVSLFVTDNFAGTDIGSPTPDILNKAWNTVFGISSSIFENDNDITDLDNLL